jgi:hypothetical protein
MIYNRSSHSLPSVDSQQHRRAERTAPRSGQRGVPTEVRSELGGIEDKIQSDYVRRFSSGQKADGDGNQMAAAAEATAEPRPALLDGGFPSGWAE